MNISSIAKMVGISASHVSRLLKYGLGPKLNFNSANHIKAIKAVRESYFTYNLARNSVKASTSFPNAKGKNVSLNFPLNSRFMLAYYSEFTETTE